MGEHSTCWIDHEYDREHAVAGSSRYAELVGENVGAFEGCWGDIAPVAFDTAMLAVAVLVRELNELLDPIVEQLETAGAPG